MGGVQSMFAKFIIEPLSNGVTLGFTSFIAALFVVALYRSLKQYKAPFDRHAPTILTTLGVTGTFVGIYVGLVYFNVEDIDGNIPSLLAGLKVAFFYVHCRDVNLHEKLTQLGGSFAFNFDPPSLSVPSGFGREFQERCFAKKNQKLGNSCESSSFTPS